MAFSKKDWAVVQAFFEQGLSLTEIVARKEVLRTGITDRGSISRKSKQEGWVKGVPQAKPMAPKPGYVYIVTAHELAGICKIGMTGDISKRIDQMQTGCPYKLLIIGLYEVEMPAAVEMMLHSFFHQKRVRGEWFSLDSADLSYIDSAMVNVSSVVASSSDDHG